MKRKTPKHSVSTRIVFLFDVDNTLLDNDRVIADLSSYLKREVGPERVRCYWTMFAQLRTRLGYADYLGALQRYRSEYPHDLRDRKILAACPAADRSMERIGALLNDDLQGFVPRAARVARENV